MQIYVKLQSLVSDSHYLRTQIITYHLLRPIIDRWHPSFSAAFTSQRSFRHPRKRWALIDLFSVGHPRKILPRCENRPEMTPPAPFTLDSIAGNGNSIAGTVSIESLKYVY